MVALYEYGGMVWLPYSDYCSMFESLRKHTDGNQLTIHCFQLQLLMQDVGGLG
jgi:hypothetical protein